MPGENGTECWYEHGNLGAVLGQSSQPFPVGICCLFWEAQNQCIESGMVIIYNRQAPSRLATWAHLSTLRNVQLKIYMSVITLWNVSLKMLCMSGSNLNSMFWSLSSWEVFFVFLMVECCYDFRLMLLECLFENFGHFRLESNVGLISGLATQVLLSILRNVHLKILCVFGVERFSSTHRHVI